MRFLLNGNSSDADYNADITHVFIDIDKKLAQLILNRADAFKGLKHMDAQALEVYFWDHSAQYLRYDAVPEKEVLRIDKTGEGGPTKWKPTKKTHIENMECCQMIVDESCVRWTAIPKHTSIYINSEQIPLAEIQKIAKGK